MTEDWHKLRWECWWDDTWQLEYIWAFDDLWALTQEVVHG